MGFEPWPDFSVGCAGVARRHRGPIRCVRGGYVHRRTGYEQDDPLIEIPVVAEVGLIEEEFFDLGAGDAAVATRRYVQLDCCGCSPAFPFAPAISPTQARKARGVLRDRCRRRRSAAGSQGELRPAGTQLDSSAMSAAMRSPIMIALACGPRRVNVGMIDKSATRSPSPP